MQLLLFTGHRYIELFLRSQPDSGGSQGWGGSGGGSNFSGGNSGGKCIPISFDVFMKNSQQFARVSKHKKHFNHE